MESYLLSLRKSMGLTQEKFAERIGISRQYYNFIERGIRKKNPDVEFAKKVAKVAGVSYLDVLQAMSK